MRIAFVLAARPIGPGGGTRIILEYANRLAARCHDVSILMPRRPLTGRPPSVAQRMRQSAAGWVRPWFGEIRRWQYLDPRVRLLVLPALHPRHIPAGDALIATAWPTAEVVAACAPSQGRALYLIQGHEIWDGFVERVNATWRLPLTKVVVASWLLELGRQLGATDLVCLPNAVNRDTFRRTRPLEARASRVAMMVARLPLKGSADGMLALEIAHRARPDFAVDLFGKIPRFRHPDWMTFYWNPPVERLVGEIYNRARIFVCPSWSEGFGLPGAEAMACGCALVSTDCGGVREYACHEVNALLSPPREPQALAANLLRLLEDDGLRLRLAAAGEASLARLSWDANTDALEALCAGQAPRQRTAMLLNAKPATKVVGGAQ